MSDLFHQDVRDHYINEVFDRMEAVDRHTYQLLTKRPERMRRFIRARYGDRSVPYHIWLGVSVENADYGWRVDHLRKINVPVRFISAEPLLGPLDGVDFTAISWVIVGGESGNGHRTMDGAWVQAIRDRCVSSCIPFFFKQWHKKATGRKLDGETWDEMPALGNAL
jgi:protein gp37